MLQVERIGKNQTVEIKFKAKTSLFDRPLQRALLYSFLFHGLIFGVFRVKFFDLPEPATTFHPVEVAIEENQEQEKSLVAVAEESKEENLIAPINRENLNFLQTTLDYEELLADAQFLKKQAPDITTRFTSEKLEFQEPYYPLKIHLTKALSCMKLIEDGSSLFKKRESHSMRYASYPIEYTIKVSSKTGTVVTWKRKKELIDKKLQAQADRLIQELRFSASSSSDSLVGGKVVIVFTCTGDELERMLQ
ncbi:MAG: hypothetical protein JWO53_90 [Chlamydiia bacterium]|nr:hypothetical protein [Chlamydiia bacterium]